VSRLPVALLFLVLAGTSSRAQADEGPAHSGLQLGVAMGFSLNPPPVCRECVTYGGLGMGFGIDLGWALTRNLALDLSLSSAVMLFADDTNAFVQVFDLGARRWWGRWWGRLGAGVGGSIMSSKDFGERYDGVAAWDKAGPGGSVGVGYEAGSSRWKASVQGRLLVAKVPGALASAVLLLLGFGRS
jgi:hypothetical protein